MKVGISACSNGHLPEWQDQIKTLKKVLASMNIEAALVTHIIKTTDEYSGTDKERAEDFMNFYLDEEIDSIYDILKMHISEKLPVVCKREIGHGHNAKAIMIGKEHIFRDRWLGATQN